MARLSHQVAFDLPKAGMLRLDDLSGVELHCVSGTLWLTLDNDPKDIVLEAGDSFATSARRPAIVYALAPASARLLYAAGVSAGSAAAAPSPSWTRWLRARLQGGSRSTTAAPT